MGQVRSSILPDGHALGGEDHEVAAIQEVVSEALQHSWRGRNQVEMLRWLYGLLRLLFVHSHLQQSRQMWNIQQRK